MTVLPASHAVPQKHSPTDTIRTATVEDLPWLLAVGAEIFPDINKEHTGQFLYYAMGSSNFLVLRGEHAFGCFVYEPWPFNHAQLRAYEIFLASEKNSGWEIYSIAKRAVAWAQKAGCELIQFQPKTSLDPVMKRLGFVTEQPSYTLTLKAVH